MTLTRGIDPVLLAALDERQTKGFFPIAFIDLDWPTGRLRMHTKRGVITWGGFDWTGVADVAALSLPAEEAGFAISPGTIYTVGPLDDLFDAVEAVIKGREAVIWWGMTETRNDTTLIGEPFQIFAGYMDGTKLKSAMTLRDGQRVQSHGLELTLGSGPGAKVAASITHSHEDQSTKFPGDTAGRHTGLAGPNAAKLLWPE
jgi:hypothetical protein